MKRKLLFDSGVASDYVLRRNRVYERASDEVAKRHKIGICLPVLGELLGGVEFSAIRERNRQRMIDQASDFAEWPFDRPAAEEYGRLFAYLRRIGRPMQQIDIQIAAVAMTLPRCTLVTRDSDFNAIPGLSLENW